MRIHQLNLIRYGKFTDRPVTLPRNTQDARDIHFIVGPNEAGKSTLRAAIGCIATIGGVLWMMRVSAKG